MEDPRINGSGQQIIGGGYGMNVPCQVKVDVLHGNDLAVSTAGRAALDSEGWSLAGLTNAREDVLAKVRSQSLTEADCCGRLSLTERRRCDRGDHHVFAVGDTPQAVSNREVYFRFRLTVQIQFVGQDARIKSDFLDRNGPDGLGDLDV